jgi:hypothetical protein
MHPSKSEVFMRHQTLSATARNLKKFSSGTKFCLRLLSQPDIKFKKKSDENKWSYLKKV